MGLHHDSPGRTPFEIELRRRIWHQIRFLDVFTALDRGTEPMITVGSYDTPFPCNVNDSDYDEASTTITPREGEITDMSFSLMAYEATDITQRMNMPDLSPKGDTWQQRLALAEDFIRRTRENYFRYCDRSIPFHRLLLALGASMGSGQVLRAVRPLQRHLSSVPPRVDSPYVLQKATDCLAASEKLHDDPEVAKWMWMVWVQWHGLAVALAGLCSIRDTEQADTSWIYVNRAYERYSKVVADTRNGMLWRPIEKLYKKASAFRDQGRRQSETSAAMRPPTVPVNWNTLSRPLPKSASYPMASSASDAVAPPINTHLTSSRIRTGAMPIDPLMSVPMDFDITGTTADFATVNSFLNKQDGTLNGQGNTQLQPDAQMQNGDMGWLDWERMMDDLSAMDPSHINMGDLQQPEYVAQDAGWHLNLNGDLV